jgi:hypothetical protein
MVKKEWYLDPLEENPDLVPYRIRHRASRILRQS